MHYCTRRDSNPRIGTGKSRGGKSPVRPGSDLMRTPTEQAIFGIHVGIARCTAVKDVSDTRRKYPCE